MANYPIPDNPQYDPQVRKLENSDPANAETVFNPTLSRMVENTAAVKAQLEEHKEDATLHVTEAQKAAWDAKAAADHTHDDRYYTEAEITAQFNEKAKQIEQLSAKVGRIEDMFLTGVTKNPWSVEFGDLDGVSVAGVWNVPMQRVEF